jgi:geranylgeranyl diphosphate synthase type II
MIFKDINTYRIALNKAIDKLEIGKEPAELYDPIKYMLSLGGKRMRPLLTILAYNLVKDDWQAAIHPALAIEVFHNFTLVHDDIMDEAPLRRGKPTVYKKWNQNIAILSGDVMMVQAYDLLLESKADDLAYILKLFNKCATDVCEGQQWDMNFEKINHVSEAEYIQMIKLKTAVLLGFSLELGGLLGGMRKEEAMKLRAFGINMGIGFQLKDDILDVYGDQQKVGKQVGGDIIANKKTYLLLKALELANQAQKSTLREQLSKSNFDAKEKVEVVKSIYNQLNIQEVSEAKMNEYFKIAFNDLEQLDIPSEKLTGLKSFTEDLINRDH